MTCAKCAAERPAANLTLLTSGERWCPECLYAKASYDWTHQVLAPAPVDAAPPRDLGLHVVDLPRSTKKKRRAA